MSLIDDYKNGKRYGTDWQAPSFQHMNDLVGTVSNANDNANNALNKSTTAESNSSTALTKATTAESNSADAVSTANAANIKSDNANTKADNANTKSDQAINTANEANTKATNAETIANNLTQAPDISEANKFGIANVEIIGTDTNKKFKFSNLKGNGIANIAKTGSDGLQDIYTITFDNGGTFSFNVTNGKSITNISKTNTSGLVDTYTITYNDTSTSIFTVTNGDSIELRVDSGYVQWKYTNSDEWLNLIAVGDLSKIDDALSTTSTNAVQNKVITNALNNIWKTIYPIGSIYLSVNSTSPASLFGGSWEVLAGGYALWTTTTSGEGGKTISAGLPNITGTTPMLNSLWNYEDATGFNDEFSGAMYSYTAISNGPGPTGSNKCQTRFGFDANKSNSIYGNSTTVQPPAIKIFAWKRTA